MPQICYAVTATLPSESLVREYLTWLQGGHTQAVLAGGASSVQIVRLDRPSGESAPDGPARVMVQYVFPSREAFDRYEREFAPALRQDGRSRFGPERGVSMQRMVGEVV